MVSNPGNHRDSRTFPKASRVYIISCKKKSSCPETRKKTQRKCRKGQTWTKTQRKCRKSQIFRKPSPTRHPPAGAGTPLLHCQSASSWPPFSWPPVSPTSSFKKMEQSGKVEIMDSSGPGKTVNKDSKIHSAVQMT